MSSNFCRLVLFWGRGPRRQQAPGRNVEGGVAISRRWRSLKLHCNILHNFTFTCCHTDPCILIYLKLSECTLYNPHMRVKLCLTLMCELYIVQCMLDKHSICTAAYKRILAKFAYNSSFCPWILYRPSNCNLVHIKLHTNQLHASVKRVNLRTVAEYG